MSQLTQLDANQVIKTVYDSDTQSLKVVGLDPIVSRLAADTDSVSIGNAAATHFIAVNADGTINVNVENVASVLTSPTTVDTTTWLNALAAGSDHTSSSVDILSYRVVGVMANWASLDQTDATLQFQGSLDASIWDNIGSATTLSSASGHQFYSLVDEPYKLIRLVYVHGTNTTGTITAKYVLRA
jgi:hypothetical protein